MEDLQRKVRDYEVRGVQATLDMQRAARTVALENSRLRALLSSKGVSEVELEKYLVSPGEGFRAQQREPNDHHRGSKGRPTAADTIGNSAPSSPASSSGTATDTSAVMGLKRLVNNDGPHPFGPLELRPAQLTTKALTINLQAQSRKREPNTSPYTSLPPLHPLSLSPHEMPRTAAAEIIAGARGHGDEWLARSALGCADAPNCVPTGAQVPRVLEDS